MNIGIPGKTGHDFDNYFDEQNNTITWFGKPNAHSKQPTFKKLSSMHFYSWQKGLKTGIYYLRTKAVTATQKFTIDPEKEKAEVDKNNVENDDCESCECQMGAEFSSVIVESLTNIYDHDIFMKVIKPILIEDGIEVEE